MPETSVFARSLTSDARASVTVLADDRDGLVPRQLGDPSGQLSERSAHRAGYPAPAVLPFLTNIHQMRATAAQQVVEFIDADLGNGNHQPGLGIHVVTIHYR